MDEMPEWPESVDLETYTRAKLDDTAGALDRGDPQGALRHLRDLGAEGDTAVADHFVSGLLRIGMRNLARKTPGASARTQAARSSFLAVADQRPSMPEPWWTVEMERRYRLSAAVLFRLYVAEDAAGDDEERRLMFGLARDSTASQLMMFDLENGTAGGPRPPHDPRWSEDTGGYVEQEQEADRAD